MLQYHLKNWQRFIERMEKMNKIKNIKERNKEKMKNFKKNDQNQKGENVMKRSFQFPINVLRNPQKEVEKFIRRGIRFPKTVLKNPQKGLDMIGKHITKLDNGIGFMQVTNYDLYQTAEDMYCEFCGEKIDVGMLCWYMHGLMCSFCCKQLGTISRIPLDAIIAQDMPGCTLWYLSYFDPKLAKIVEKKYYPEGLHPLKIDENDDKNSSKNDNFEDIYLLQIDKEDEYEFATENE